MAHSVRHFLCPEFACGQIFFYHSAYHVDVNGLNDIIVHSAFNKPLPNPRNCVRSESYNGCGAVYAVRAAYLRSCLFAVHHRHMAVHKYHIVLFSLLPYSQLGQLRRGYISVLIGRAAPRKLYYRKCTYQKSK